MRSLLNVIFDLLATASAIVLVAAGLYACWNGLGPTLDAIDRTSNQIPALAIALSLMIFTAWFEGRHYNR